jgi:hypothetical protein
MPRAPHPGAGAAAAPGYTAAPAAPSKSLEEVQREVREMMNAGRLEANRTREAGPGGYCPPRHPTHIRPLFLELNGILVS